MNQATADFIRNNADADVRQLALRGAKDPEVDLPFALDQIAGRQTARRKLPSWASIDGMIYPPHLSMEQCSSEQTARYKGKVVAEKCRTTNEGHFVDLTGGFGVDFTFMAQELSANVHHFIYVERQEHLCAIAKENFQLLGLTQAEVVCADGVEYLQTMESAEVIFIDPARRDGHGGRTYGISDCTPDVLQLRDLLLRKSRFVLLKLSPMLDWRKTVSDLGEQYVREVHIISVHNECKELLVLLGQGNVFKLICANDDHIFEVAHDDISEICQFDEPCMGNFLYEPNASIMKAGCFAELSQHFGVAAIAQNSHLFISTNLVDDFPGRVFQIEAVTSLNKRELKKHLCNISQANIAVRNFPLSVAELRQRLKLNEGGSIYIFATTLASGDRILLICRKVM